MAGVGLRGVAKRYGEHVAVAGLDLQIADGELMVLVGPSGCGKTTTLRLIAGLERVDAGAIHIGERDVTAEPPERRDVAMVFQSYALYPHLSVYENLAFGLRARRRPDEEVRERVERAAQALGIEQVLDRKPRALSGGERQRVALGRAIVREPAAFLMDEPLSNLDARLRVATRAEIQRLQASLGTTTIYVTHDQVEALSLGHRVGVMDGGALLQVGTPREVYDTPSN
ncbi:MAG: ABC transporter ATP-binding protein, partial [Actinomycetota bacterium]